MPERRVYDLGAFVVAFEDVGADFGMSPLGLVIGGLADVVEQAAAAGQAAVETDFFGHHAGEESDLDRMPQHVLAVAGAEAQPAQQVNDFGVQVADVGLLGGFLAELLEVFFEFGLGLGDDFLDARGMDATVGDQLRERNPRDFAAHHVEAADDYDAGRIVDDDVDAGGLFEGADIATFAADDAPLHIVVGDVDSAGGGFRGVGGGVALHGGDHDLAGFFLADLGHAAARAS